MANDDVLRRLRASGLRPSGGVIDLGEREMIERISNANDAQIALAKQQIETNARQLAANERNQEIAQAQWLLVYAADLYKYHRQVERDGGHYDGDVDEAVTAHILKAFGEPSNAIEERNAPANANATHGGFVEHEAE